MYYRGGWSGRWFETGSETTANGSVTKMSAAELKDLNNLLGQITTDWSGGCDLHMQRKLGQYHAKVSKTEKLYLLEAEGKKLRFVLQINTEYENGDYPIRVHCYRLDNGRETKKS